MATELIQGVLVAPSSPDPARLAMASFLAGYTGLTLQAYRLDMRHWARWCDEHRFELFGVERVHVDLFVRGLEADGRAAATICRRLGTVRMFYRWCDLEGLIGRNPAAHIKGPRRSDESPTLGLDRMELGGFLATAAATGRPVDHALICLLALNGLRVSEACGANIEALGSERGHRTLTVLGKGAKIATVPLAPRTARSIDLAVGDRCDGPLLLGRDGGRITRHDAGRIVRRVARKAGITKRIGPHSLRHSCITAALDAGVPLRDVQELARHADPKTTTRYDRARHSLDRHATYVVAAFLAGGA